MSNTNIQEKIKDYKELQRMSEELNAEMEAIKDELKQELEQRNTETLITGEYKITYKAVTSSRFDSAAFKKEHGELYKQYQKQTTSKRFTVA